MELREGRPESMEGRQEREKRVYDFLDHLGLKYWQVDHDRADTMEACRAVDDILQATICKNLFLCNRQETQFYLLMMPAGKPFKTKELSHQLGCSRLSFAPEEKMVEFLDIHPGSVSVMGLMNDYDGKVQLLVDEDVLKGEFLGCHPCVNTSSMKLYTRDVFGPFLKAAGHEYIPVKLTGEG